MSINKETKLNFGYEPYSVACQDKGSLDCGGIGFAVIMIEGAYELFAKGWGWLRELACSLFVLGWLRLARSLIAK